MTPLCMRLVWRLTLYQKREVIALFICKLPKIKVLKEKIGSEFDTTFEYKEGKIMKRKLLGFIMTGAMVFSMLTGCGSSGAEAKNGEINVFVWTEYVSDSAVSAFEKETEDRL